MARVRFLRLCAPLALIAESDKQTDLFANQHFRRDECNRLGSVYSTGGLVEAAPSMKTKTSPVLFVISTLITVVLLVIAFAVALKVVSMLITYKYGEPRLVCSGSQGVEFPERWTIEMLDLGDARWPLLYGVIPVPRVIARREAGGFFLHLTSPDGASFAVAPRVPTFDAVQSSSDCQKSAYCRLTRVLLGAEHRALVVKLDHGYAATLLDWRFKFLFPA
jgi:hypothetical protein